MSALPPKAANSRHLSRSAYCQKLPSGREKPPQPLILIVKPAPASREHPGTGKPDFSTASVTSGCDQLSTHHPTLMRGMPHRFASSEVSPRLRTHAAKEVGPVHVMNSISPPFMQNLKTPTKSSHGERVTAQVGAKWGLDSNSSAK
jgi:hypothetical protein